jgi:hypothetical protein
VRDLTESIRAELDSLAPLEILVLAAATGILVRLVVDVHLATHWRRGFRAGVAAEVRLRAPLPSPTEPVGSEA